MARKEINSLQIAIQMRDAVAYLATLASRSELQKIAHELLRVHMDLGCQIEAMRAARETERRGILRGAKNRVDAKLKAKSKLLRH